MNKLINCIGLTSVLFGLVVAIIEFAHWGHSRHCEGPKTGHCNWAWCQYYNGCDHQHDFNF